MDLISMYEKISFVGYVLAIIFLFVAVFLFFYLNIPKTFGLLSGITAKKTIEGRRNGTIKREIEEDDDTYQNYNIRKNDKAPTTASLGSTQPQPNETADLASYQPQPNETMDLTSYQPQPNETVELSSYQPQPNETVDLSSYQPRPNETVDLASYQPQPNETVDLAQFNEHLASQGFVVEEELTFIHTDERIE